MELQKGQTITITIERLAFGGAGIGKLDGRAVFVEGSMIGDTVEASLTKIKKSYAEAKLEKIVSPSEKRISPRCPHFGLPIAKGKACGGCVWQFMAYEDQLKWKTEQVKETFEHIGGLKNLLIRKCKASPEQWYYRNKMEYSFGKTFEEKPTLGLHQWHRRYDLIDLETCFLQSEASMAIVKKFQEQLLGSPNDSFRSLFIREGKNTNEIMIHLLATEEISKNWGTFLSSLREAERRSNLDGIASLPSVARNDGVVSVYLTILKEHRGKPHERNEILIAGKKKYRELLRVNNHEFFFDVSPSAFFQPNTHQAEQMYEQMLAYTNLTGHEIVYDLFCGIGTTSLPLAKQAKHAWGVEWNATAVKDAKENASLNKISNVTFLKGDVRKILDEIPEKPDLITLDPPRSGLEPRVIEKICELNVKHLIYMSCNPATLARDSALLVKNGFGVREIQPFDQFPHTAHIEVMVDFLRE